MKKGFFYKHPIIGGIIALILVMIICNAIGGLVGVGAAYFEYRAAVRAGEIAESTGDIISTLELIRPYVSSEFSETVANIAVALSALLCLLIFCLLNRKNKYLGPFKIRGKKLKDVKIFIAVFVTLDIIAALLYLFTYPGGFPKIPLSLSMIVLALYAGFNEEISDRAIPTALMMRNKPTSRRITATVLITAVWFGAGHIINLLSGRDLIATIIQIIFAAGAGLFFIGIYLRTGSITLTIAIHALHDFLVFVTASVPEVESTLLINDLLTIIINFLPFVFGILMVLPKHHPAIIDAWTRIWPDNESVATEAENE